MLEEDDFSVSLRIPVSVDVPIDGNMILEVKNGRVPEMTDVILLQDAGGISYVATIVDISTQSISVRLPSQLVSGTYRISIKRGSRKKQLGTLLITIVDSLDFKPAAGTTVYGKIHCGGKPVPGVVVSDGVEVTCTDEHGIYEMHSLKENRYVFMSVPSGYEALSDGIRPLFYSMLKADYKVCERVDFELRQSGDQTNYTLLVLGDMHLANRTKDLQQFKEFTDEVNTYLVNHKKDKIYGLTLGDMTWDTYWYTNRFAFPQYLDVMNEAFHDLQIWHTMGNHDNDYKGLDDYTAAEAYIRYVCPPYYSFNIGHFHYIVLDDIDCRDYDGTTSRRFHVSVTNLQFEWLKKDLQYVSKDTPVIITMHAQLFNPETTSIGYRYRLPENDVRRLFDIIEGYDVSVITGHTHNVFNVTNEDAKVVASSKGITNEMHVREHNSGSVCASWWWSGNLTPGIHLSTDGSHGGYAIWNVQGDDYEYSYKATGRPESHQFHAYDLNNVSFSMDDVPLMPDTVPQSVKDEYMKYVEEYPGLQNNEVLINIWNWSPEWSLEVTDENGNRLDWKQVVTYDPLHIAALTVKRFNTSSLNATPAFITLPASHFFKVKLQNATDDIKISVKDQFGHVYEEKMARPQKFSFDVCRR